MAARSCLDKRGDRSYLTPLPVKLSCLISTLPPQARFNPGCNNTRLLAWGFLLSNTSEIPPWEGSVRGTQRFPQRCTVPERFFLVGPCCDGAPQMKAGQQTHSWSPARLLSGPAQPWGDSELKDLHGFACPI